MSQSIGILLICLVFSHICAAIPLNPKEEPNQQLKCIKTDDIEYGEVVSNGQQEDQGKQESSCELCGEQFNRLKGYRTKCNHIFHEHCLDEWVHELRGEPRFDCPICKEQLVFEGDQTYQAYFSNDEGLELVKQLLKDNWGVVGSLDWLTTIEEGTTCTIDDPDIWRHILQL